MNWKLIFLLSLIAIPVAFGTVYFIPINVEPVIWIVIFIFCAWIIATYCAAKFFLNGFMISVFNSVWITVIHFILFDTFYAHQPALMAMTDATPEQMRLGGLITGPVIGVISGLILGLFSWIAAKIMKKA
jgi:uncharacterized membrane protein